MSPYMADERDHPMFKLILKAIDNTITAEGADYFKRPSGSYVPWLRADADEGSRAAGVLRELARDGVYEDVTEEVRRGGNAFGCCRYYKAPIEGGVEAACLLSDLDDAQLALVRVGKGQHGIELQAPSLEARPTDHFHLCVGSAVGPFAEPDETTAQVYFWAPGRVLPRFDGKATTVKLG